ncbi:lantibiotic dehydratase [Actinokineospora auranticolor]|uniref:Lantibiotic biosynthesis dehydratase-like protein n=1 Tax=Actinokineospora auranticolor TaxID=155976 RepID=A0A2S6GPN8_9PSEU|nr:lantibiotic dehydratase [Actinokineospora auranticolor]PPK67091.1 lantibiotic biosynthesis dehydratase-like protein [Actinokineospora auranticolor]
MTDDALTWTVPAGPGDLLVSVQPWTLLRTTGFPISLIEPLATVDRALIDRVLAAHDAVAALRAEFLDGMWPRLADAVRGVEPRQRSLRALRACRRLVQESAEIDDTRAELLTALDCREWTLAWNTAVADLAGAGPAEFDSALSAAYEYVAAMASDDRLRHAVFVSNPGFHSALARQERPARRDLDTVHRYLRRLCTKCETVSFFGPVLFADLRPGQPEPVAIDPPGPERVVVEASAWLVEALADRDAAATAPEDQLAWRNPMFRALDSGQGLEHVRDGRRFRVRAEAMALWCDSDGTPVGARAPHARALGPALTVAPWRLPATELHALTRLAEARPDGPAADLAAHRDKYAAAGWPERVAHLDAARELATELVGGSERHAGRHYADRGLFHEDRSSPYSERVHLGEPVVRRLRDVTAAVFPLVYLAALLTRADARDVLRAELDGAPASLAALAARELPERTPRRDRLADRLRELVAAEGPELTGAALARALAPFWADPAVRDWDACLPSPDFMLVGADPATATWVLAELHDDCSSIFGGLERPLHGDPDGLWAGFTERVGAAIPDAECATIVSRRRSAHVTPELPGASIELSGLSAKPRAEVVAIAEVAVPAAGDAVEVDGTRRLLYPGDLSSTLHRALSRPAVVPVPVDLGTHTPRVTVDGVVLQRARWRFTLPAPGADRFDRWRALQLLRRDLGLPRYVYVRHPAEPKPLHLDFHDPLSVLDLARLPAVEVVASEMLPTPDQLWWRVDGAAHCAELRTGFVLRRAPSTTPTPSTDRAVRADDPTRSDQ